MDGRRPERRYNSSMVTEGQLRCESVRELYSVTDEGRAIGGPHRRRCYSCSASRRVVACVTAVARNWVAVADVTLDAFYRATAATAVRHRRRETPATEEAQATYESREDDGLTRRVDDERRDAVRDALFVGGGVQQPRRRGGGGGVGRCRRGRRLREQLEDRQRRASVGERREGDGHDAAL